MGLINLLLKALILVLDLRDTYDALDGVKLEEIGCNERTVLVRNAQDGAKQLTTRRRVGTSKRKAAVKSALTTVLVWNLFQKIEPICDRTIAWFVPFYDSFKTLFLLWMLFTRSYGASILVYRILAPMIRPYESIIDGVIGVTLALFGWIASLLAPLIDRCTALIHSIKSIAVVSPHSIPTRASEDTKSNMSPTGTIATAKTKKKPPPPSSLPPPSVKASPTSITLKASNAALQSRLVTNGTRQELTKKTSQSSLAATRRVLQELPVPSHAFDSARAASDATSQATNGVAPSPNRTTATVVKTELASPSMAAPRSAGSVPSPSSKPANLGPPPTPPTGLSNYAFIPGMTPQRAGPSNLISPTPRFPGGFSFSVAAPSASNATGANPFQPHTRVPLTTQMAPLSLSSQLPAMQPFGALGLTNGVASKPLTHESVVSADDDRIVPPPNGVPAVRKVSSSRSLKSKTPTVATKTASSGKKRSRTETDTEEVEIAGSKSSKRPTASPRKRAKPAASKAAARTTASAATTAKARSKANATSSSSSTPVGTVRAAAQEKITTSGAPRVPKKQAVAQDDKESAKQFSATGDGSAKSKPSSSPSKKALSATTSSKPTAQRRAVKKASTASKAARGESVDSAEPSDPPQRLTRSRTKQNLAG